MATPTAPIDIQQYLDDWLAGNPPAQKYLIKLWYLREGQPVPPEVTHQVQLSSMQSAERALTIGLVVVPEFAVVLDGLLALIATQPPH